MKWNKVMLLNLLLFLATVGLGQESAYLLLLTVAQLIYIPAMLQLIDRKEDWFRAYYPYVAIPAYLSVVLLHITNQTEWDYLFAITYFLFTCFVSTYGISRFLRRGFIQFEEFVIDMGLIYLSIGGIWFFAHITHIDTGFSPMITWLTAIHFHYAAFLLPVFVGFLGRIYKPAYYPLAASIILFSPIVLAIGITFSIWIEVFSVVLYIAGIYTLIFFALKVPLIHCLQKGLIILSFGSLGVTILFSFMYAFGRIWGEDAISIAFMLQFHGFLNSVLFALSGVIGWSIFTPPAKTENWIFPVSKVRGASTVGERILSEIIDNKKGNSYNGLVDQMKIFEPDIHVDSLAPAILDFYEHTLDYRLYAEVKWETWFK
ncbi:MAG TPA: YndJ family protein, partial [Chondromyces sp.]|nr:YndJ family protein [Chondromyces sp.]